MVRQFVVSALSCCVAGLVLVAATPASAGETATLLRTTLTVADVDRSLAFYALLGFRVESEMGGERSPDSPFPLNSRSSRWRLVILAPAAGEGGKIGLLSFAQASPSPTRAPTRDRIGLGDMVFVFDVPDAVAVHATLEADGARIVEEPVTYQSKTTDAAGRSLTGRVFHVFDPDGYLIEILEAPQ
jgi:catechol 2,3-dioxygenase-like lactoylglutathione lyase family enzyme